MTQTPAYMTLPRHCAVGRLLARCQARLCAVARVHLAGRVPADVFRWSADAGFHLQVLTWRLGSALARQLGPRSRRRACDADVRPWPYPFGGPHAWVVASPPDRERGPLGPADHRALGTALRGLSLRLRGLSTAVASRYPRRCAAHRAARAPWWAVDALRVALDAAFLDDHPAAYDERAYFPAPAERAAIGARRPSPAPPSATRINPVPAPVLTLTPTPTPTPTPARASAGPAPRGRRGPGRPTFRPSDRFRDPPGADFALN